jgi:hypothetical protein
MGKRRRQLENRPPDRNEQTRLSEAGPAPSPRAFVLLAAIALMLMIIGARWWFIGKFSSDVPWLDQWDAEAQGLYQPSHAGTLGFQNWFAPHNEHRILFTRLLAMALLRLNRQWDPRLQMVVNASLYAMVAAGIFWVLRRGKGLRFSLFCWALVAALGSAPYGASNILLGFQSQFYFLAGFSLLAIYCLVNSRPGSAAWTAGVLSGAAALLSMASGQAAALATLAVLVFAAFRAGESYRLELRRQLATVGAACALAVAGFFFRYSPPGHEQLAAKSAGDFVRYLTACLAWPNSPMVLFAIATWLPFGNFALGYLRRMTKDGPVERFVLGIGLWVLLQAAALSIFRANSEEGLESRYTEILGFGILANAVCVIWLFETKGRMQTLMAFLGTAWLALTGFGLYRASFDGNGFQWKQLMEIRRMATAGFVATGQQEYLDKAPPHSDPAHVAALLRDPALRGILPVGIQKPLELEPQNGAPAPLLLNGFSTPDAARITPDVWTQSGVFAKFAVLQPSSPFAYRVRKQTGLPYLLLYLVGNPGQVSVAGHGISMLPGDAPGQGQHAVASCPTAECIVSGSGQTGPLAIMEPKEIGWWSVEAVRAAVWGPVVFGAGLALLLGGLVMGMRREPLNGTRAEKS